MKRNNRGNGNESSNRSNNKRNNIRSASAAVSAVLTGLTVLAAAAAAHGAVVYAAQEETQSALQEEIQSASQEGIQNASYALSGSGTSGQIRSRGRVQYEYAVIDGDDLRAVGTYISEQKDAAAGALIRLGTRFRQQSGEYVYDRNPDAGQEDIDLGGLSWTILTQAAKESQNVPAGLSVLNPEAALHIEGVAERTDFYEAAIEDNLSEGKAAWVNGRLLLGNGADNDKAYRQGLVDGEEEDIPDNLCPIYGAQEAAIEIVHKHIGNREEREGTSGCYYNHCETIVNERSCSLELVYCDSVWYPNENEPEGGSWHGGYYTCPYHNGIYDSPGVCGQRRTVSTTVWKHDVICGQEKTLYARLMIEPADAEDSGQPEGQICLRATMEEGEGYARLNWKDGDELVWTDDRGNVLGTGTDLIVFEPGIYRCSINVSNTDINRQTAEAQVTVSGLMMCQGN